MDDLNRWQRIPAQERILLLPHCLRPSSGCPGQMTRMGLICPTACALPCPIGQLRQEAERLGYKGTYVAPGGALALRLVRETKPQGILAIACLKELREGQHAVEQLEGKPLAVVTLPLSRDGCVDTEVDVQKALELLRLGLCAELASAKGLAPAER